MFAQAQHLQQSPAAHVSLHHRPLASMLPARREPERCGRVHHVLPPLRGSHGDWCVLTSPFPPRHSPPSLFFSPHTSFSPSLPSSPTSQSQLFTRPLPLAAHLAESARLHTTVQQWHTTQHAADSLITILPVSFATVYLFSPMSYATESWSEVMSLPEGPSRFPHNLPPPAFSISHAHLPSPFVHCTFRCRPNRRSH